MYIYCVYSAMLKNPKQLANFTEKRRKKSICNHFLVCPLLRSRNTGTISDRSHYANPVPGYYYVYTREIQFSNTFIYTGNDKHMYF
jgi:hypothetical protein